MSTRVWALSAVFLMVGYAGPARADLIVSIVDTTVAQGGTGIVDVYLTGTNPITPDQINQYAFQLQITNNGSNGTQLAFSNTQDFSYDNNTSLNPGYVFLGDSSAAQPPATPIGAPSPTVYPNDTFIGTDSTFSGNTVGISSSTTYLLASLTLTTATGVAPIAGDSFTISLIPASGSGSINDNPNTYFDNYNFGNGNENSATPFTSTSGTVRITPASTAVPEPASILSALTGIVMLAGFAGSRRCA